MSKHLSLEERISIQVGLKDNLSYAQIAEQLGKSKSTVSREIQKHRTFVPHTKAATLQTHNVCVFRTKCNIKEKCKSPTCYHSHYKNCRFCGSCNTYCKEFQEEICPRLSEPSFVCNRCTKKPRCPLSKWIYDAKQAQAAYEKNRSESRQGISLSEDELLELDKLVTPLLKNGQSVRHICNTNIAEIPISDRTIYKYIRENYLSTDLFALRRTVQRSHRKKSGPPFLVDKSCRINRLYSDFLTYQALHPGIDVVEADSVEGTKGGKVLLTLFFRNCGLQLAFLRDKNTSASVSKIFDDLRDSLSFDEFSMIFPVILCDRGSEFSDPVKIEVDPKTQQNQCYIFYCDPQNTNQKSECERNHELIRYILPKGTSFDALDQSKVQLMMCHINSYGRSVYNDKSPTELFHLIYGKEIAEKLGVKLIPSKDIVLRPELIR